MRVRDVAPPEALPAARGTYALVVHLPRATRLQIGRLGAFDFPRGAYVYVGSARGAGGLRARVLRHWRAAKKFHWHIDYLRAAATPLCVWYSTAARDDECLWAHAFTQHPRAAIVVPRFGARDCACAAHLFYLGASRRGDELAKNLDPILAWAVAAQTNRCDLKTR